MAAESNSGRIPDIAWLSPGFGSSIWRSNSTRRHAQETACASFWAKMLKLFAQIQVRV
jgi:hypothetical protein